LVGASPLRHRRGLNSRHAHLPVVGRPLNCRGPSQYGDAQRNIVRGCRTTTTRRTIHGRPSQSPGYGSMLFTKRCACALARSRLASSIAGRGAACIHLLRACLPERENVGLDPAREEGDLEGAVADRSALPDQVVEPRLDNPSVPLVVDVDSADTSLRDEPAGRALPRDLRPFCVVERGVCGRCR
jgi:hypothetical protein